MKNAAEKIIACKQSYTEIETLIDQLIYVLNMYRRAITLREERLGRFYAEVNERIRQLRQLLADILSIHIDFIVAHHAQVNKISYPAADKLPEASNISDRMKTYVESWYYIAHRIKTAVNNKTEFPGIGSFSPSGLRKTRNNLIEHREMGDDIGNYGVAVVEGLFLGNGQNFGKYPDPGFILNAKEFFIELIKVLSRVEKPPVKKSRINKQKKKRKRNSQQDHIQQTINTIETKGSILKINNVTADMDGNKYRCVATNENGITISMTAILTVKKRLPSNYNAVHSAVSSALHNNSK